MATVNMDIVHVLTECGCVDYAKRFAGLTMEKLSKYNIHDLIRVLPREAGSQVAYTIYQQVCKSKRKVEVDDVQQMVGSGAIYGPYMGINSHTVGYGASSSKSQPRQFGNNLESNKNDSEDDDQVVQKITLDPEIPLFIDFQNHKYFKIKILSHVGSQNCANRYHQIPKTLKKWKRGLNKWGFKIYSLEMSTWTWQELISSCPYNLFKILVDFCPTLHELILTANISQCDDQYQMSISKSFPQNFKLPKLEVLRLCHDGDLTCLDQLKEILVASVNLRKIYYLFGVPKAATSFLKILRGLTRDQLKNLKVLSIKSTNNDSCLNQMHFIQLAKIDAFSLEELELGNGISDDVDGPTIQEMLFCLPNLKKLTIHGCFNGTSLAKPNILINFPNMNHLEYVDIGSNYIYAPVYEDENMTAQMHPTNTTKRAKLDETISDHLQVVSFPVTLQFPILPNLKILQLGNLFEIKELHFASFPTLEGFYVGSRWDLSVSFPKEEKSRRSSYPLVTHLKIPDCLDDPLFIKLIPNKFPNLTYCSVTLPTLKLLRTFFKAMSNSKLNTLRLRTRFDFSSTLDTCFLDKPTSVNVCQMDVNKVKLLKEYGHWEEYVKFYSIQLPVEDLSSLEGDDMAGLSSLTNLVELGLDHFPRILRIPKGNIHWTSHDCQFTDEFIGFREYPWSASCEQLRNNLMKKNLVRDIYFRYDNKFRVPRKPDNLIVNCCAVPTRKINGHVKIEPE